MLNPKAVIELFHLIFLRQFSTQIPANFYAIKGGSNLRFFFNSVRYSEDLDLDVVIVQKQTLENKIHRILASISLPKLLQGYGIDRIMFTSPKQTYTTQQWKIQLFLRDAEMPLHTKVEFSRRHEKIETELANVDMKICQIYRLSPMRLSHYGLREVITQKILALAGRPLTQARDIFDLYFLLHIDTPTALKIEKNILDKAKNAISLIDFEHYESQVVNFLDTKAQKIYDDQGYWNTISNEVFNYLERLT